MRWCQGAVISPTSDRGLATIWTTMSTTTRTSSSGMAALLTLQSSCLPEQRLRHSHKPSRRSLPAGSRHGTPGSGSLSSTADCSEDARLVQLQTSPSSLLVRSSRRPHAPPEQHRSTPRWHLQLSYRRTSKQRLPCQWLRSSLRLLMIRSCQRGGRHLLGRCPRQQRHQRARRLLSNKQKPSSSLGCSRQYIRHVRPPGH
jgi:hypothetical protein